MSDLILRLGDRGLELELAEAREIYDRLVERNLALLKLQSELSRAIEPGPGQHEIEVDEETRQELLLCLDAIDSERALTSGLRSLRQAARVPIAPRPEY